jgi:hypothetical protein
MGFVLVLVLVLLVVAGFVTFLVLNATRKSGPAADDGAAPGVGADESPLGDTIEHAGEQSTEGTAVGRQDADATGGTGRPVQSGPAGTTGAGDEADPDAAAHGARPGEGEGREQLDFDGERPAARERP